MRAWLNILMAMQSVWSNGRRRRWAVFHRLISDSGLISPDLAAESRRLPRRRKVRGV